MQMWQIGAGFSEPWDRGNQPALQITRETGPWQAARIASADVFRGPQMLLQMFSRSTNYMCSRKLLFQLGRKLGLISTATSAPLTEYSLD